MGIDFIHGLIQHVDTLLCVSFIMDSCTLFVFTDFKGVFSLNPGVDIAKVEFDNVDWIRSLYVINVESSLFQPESRAGMRLKTRAPQAARHPPQEGGYR